jgi:hypothetical protein
MEEVLYNTNLLNLNLLYMNGNSAFQPIVITSESQKIDSPYTSGGNSPVSSSQNSPKNTPSPSFTLQGTKGFSPSTKGFSPDGFSSDRYTQSRDDEISFLKNMRSFNKSILVNCRR